MHHVAKVEAVVEYIEANLTQKLTLETLAETTHYAALYLQRAFTRTVGMTPHDYLTRRRLTEAAKLLVFSRKPIVEIALLSGYESQQAFHGAFQSMYKLSPNRYREGERFYPLQLKFKFEKELSMPDKKKEEVWDVALADATDIPRWMTLVRLAIDGLPHLHEEEHIKALRQRIRRNEAFLIAEEGVAVGILLFSRKTGSIELMGTHPLYRHRGIPQTFLRKVMDARQGDRPISITTYREGDKADVGHRRRVKALGFAEAELLEEFGYPTQRFILPDTDSR